MTRKVCDWLGLCIIKQQTNLLSWFEKHRKRMTFMLHMTYQTLICHLNREQVFAWWCKGTNSNLFISTTHMKVWEGRRIRVEKQRNQSKVREIEMREGEIFHLWQMELREEWERMVSVCRQLRKMVEAAFDLAFCICSSSHY